LGDMFPQSVLTLIYADFVQPARLTFEWTRL